MTTTISIKTTKEKKERLRKVAKERGISLNSLMNEVLDNAIEKARTMYVVNDKEISEEPSEWLKKVMRKAEKDRKAGKGSPIFDNAKDAISWLHR